MHIWLCLYNTYLPICFHVHAHPLKQGHNKNTLETCKNPRPTSCWSELTKSCTTSTMNFHIVYFSWIPQNNASVNEHLDFKPTWSICNTISDNIVIQLIWKFQESNWNPDWFITLMDSFDTNYIFTNNKNLGKYDQNAIPSQIMPCYSYPGNLIDQNEIPIELTCQQAHLRLIMSLMSMKMLANMVHMWYSLRWCHVTGIL